MNRKNFLRKSLLSLAGIATGNSVLRAKNTQTKKSTYDFKKSQNGVYAFILEGEVTIEGQQLNRRNGFGGMGYRFHQNQGG